MRDESPKPPLGAAALKPGEDYYYEGPYLVFTAQDHLKRGNLLQLGMQALPIPKLLWYRGSRRRSHLT